MRENSWRVIFHKNGKRVWKRFQGDSPSPAVAFAKQVKRAGYLDVEIVSSRAFPCPPSKLKLRQPGQLWCPFCLKWREFKHLVVKFPMTGYSQPDLRCPVCFITPRDYFVRIHNPGNPLLYREEMEPVKLRVKKNSPASMSNIKRRRRR